MVEAVEASKQILKTRMIEDAIGIGGLLGCKLRFKLGLSILELLLLLATLLPFPNLCCHSNCSPATTMTTATVSVNANIPHCKKPLISWRPHGKRKKQPDGGIHVTSLEAAWSRLKTWAWGLKHRT